MWSQRRLCGCQHLRGCRVPISLRASHGASWPAAHWLQHPIRMAPPTSKKGWKPNCSCVPQSKQSVICLNLALETSGAGTLIVGLPSRLLNQYLKCKAACRPSGERAHPHSFTSVHTVPEPSPLAPIRLLVVNKSCSLLLSLNTACCVSRRLSSLVNDAIVFSTTC